MAQWQTLLTHVQSIKEGTYETWVPSEGYNNITQFGAEFGENGVSWCVIFDWDMYHDCGLDAIVPKTDNVTSFSSWARARGQWSDYPSIGAWVNFGNGEHTEIVVGFDDTNVYTKGGNTNNSGSPQGDGVYSHSHVRKSDYVTGYFAPNFPDGVCPPTADPNDYRLRHIPVTPPIVTPKPPVKPVPVPAKPPTYRAPAFPTGLRPNSSSPSAKTLQQALIDTGWLSHQVAKADNYGPLTQAAVAGFNKKHNLNDTGLSYDPAIGPRGWNLLFNLAYA